MKKLNAFALAGLVSLGLTAQSTSPYCHTEVTHLGIPAEVASKAYLTVANLNSTTMKIEVESADADPVDDLVIAGAAGATISPVDLSVPGIASRTLSWTTPPATVDFNVLWSKVSFGGNWQLIDSAAGGTFNFADTCGPVVPPAPGDISFSVDMNNYANPFDTVYVSGSFNVWSGDANPLSDIDGDGIWTGTVSGVAPGSHDYKFTLDNWTAQENLIAGTSCTVTNSGFTNRSLSVDGDATQPEVCWEACSNCASAPVVRDVTFKVDMRYYAGSYTTVNVNGTFNNWCGGCNPMSDADGDSIYEVTLPLTSGTIEYKFTVDGWTDQENFSPGGSCTVTNSGYTNRELTFTNDVVLDAVCWNSCSPCTAISNKNVTFTVDVSDYTGTYTGIFLNGEFNSWCGSCAPMTDMGNDIWSLTVPITADSIEYKFTADGWNDQENFVGGEPCTKSAFGYTNRFVELLGDTVLSEVCWSSCSDCTGIPTSADVTFRVDMSEYTGTYSMVNVNGTFNGWCGSCAVMTDADGDSIYELTVNVPTAGFEYKFTVDGWNGEEMLTPGDACVLTTGGYTNRFLQTNTDTIMPAVCWNSCSECGVTPPLTVGCVDSVGAINANKGVYRAYFNGLSSADDYRLEYKAMDETTWRTKSIADASTGSQKFNLTPSFGTTVMVRLALNDAGTWTPGCEVALVVPCTTQAVSIVVQKDARCVSDSVLLRAGYAGGFGVASFMWSNGATTKRTYADQGEMLYVTVTDAAGCSVSDTITAGTFDNTAVPMNFSVNRDNPTTYTGTWTAPSLPSGATLIGYRMAYRLRNTVSYTNVPGTTTGNSMTVDFTGSGLPAGNYEFVAFTRYNDGAAVVNSNFSCTDVKGYTGTGNKTDVTANGSSTSSVSVYPNPTNGELYASAPQGSEVVLMDINGRVIATQVVEGSEAQFDISALSEGVYMLRIQTSNELITERIIKQ
jgi:hypothetical protein